MHLEGTLSNTDILIEEIIVWIFKKTLYLLCSAGWFKVPKLASTMTQNTFIFFLK